ncbi:hypothetical protein [Streptomyces sp. NPDC057336]
MSSSIKKLAAAIAAAAIVEQHPSRHARDEDQLTVARTVGSASSTARGGR